MAGWPGAGGAGAGVGRCRSANQDHVAVGGGACLCYLPTVLAKQLGEFDKAGLAVELVDLKGGSEALKAVLGGSADVVSGYFDHCVNLAAKGQGLQSFVVYDRYPGLVLVVSPSHTGEIKSIKDLAGKKVGVSAPGSSTDFFLKYLLKKNGLDPASAAVIGVGLGATAVAAMEQGQIDAAVMLDPAVTVLQGSHPDLKILSDTRTQKDTLERVRRRISGRGALLDRGLGRLARERGAGADHQRWSIRWPGFTSTRRKRSWRRCRRKWSARTRSCISRR